MENIEILALEFAAWQSILFQNASFVAFTLVLFDFLAKRFIKMNFPSITKTNSFVKWWFYSPRKKAYISMIGFGLFMLLMSYYVLTDWNIDTIIQRLDK